MNKYSIYFDTSIINFLFADDAPEKRDITIEYFENYVKTNMYNHYVSKIVVDEILRTKNIEKREKLLNVIDEFQLPFLPLEPEDEINNLVAHYIRKSIVPENKIDDAFHVAVVIVHKIDILLSRNFRHLANINKERKFLIANFELGYTYSPRLTNPMEVFND